jgi:CheY-like chemotaxis protein
MTESKLDSKPIKHVLVIDDDEITRRLAKAELTDNGFSVDIVSGHQEALAYLQNHGATVDVIVSEITMPNGSGYQLLSQLRAQGCQIPYFLFSGNEEVTEESALKMGANGFLRKPFKIGRLTVKIVLYFAQEQNRLSAKNTLKKQD